jgi:SAM-dependent methyltransferase
MDEIIKKVFHYIKSHKDRELIETWCNELPLNEFMEKTYELSNYYMSDKIRTKVDKPPDYISRIIARKTGANEHRTYVDIGGGNGNVLSYIRANVVGDAISQKENYVCVESGANWAEPYPFDRDNIKYLFWDNRVINLRSGFAHVILCMVSLHHMNDTTIHNVLLEMKRILCNGGVILMKEHDCNSSDVVRYTEMEHHLYHVRTRSMEGKPLDVDSYLKTCVFNFKSKAEWLRLFMNAGFVLRTWKNRVLGSDSLPNSTQLFWGIFS